MSRVEVVISAQRRRRRRSAKVKTSIAQENYAPETSVLPLARRHHPTELWAAGRIRRRSSRGHRRDLVPSERLARGRRRFQRGVRPQRPRLSQLL